MKKVITYGSYDLLHYGHIRLLERAKALGDYLIVGVTSDDYDKTRGKINLQQSLMERVEAVRQTGLADEIIIEEYEGQKIDDIKRYGVDIFTVGSDWEGYFDYLKEYCEVIYLPRTEGVSSSDIRAEKSNIRLKIVGESIIEQKFKKECLYVNGVEIADEKYNAQYVYDLPENHYRIIKKLLNSGKSVICESPIALNSNECLELFELAKKNKCFLFDGLKTAYSTAFTRLLLIIKSGKIGDVVSIDATCTSMAGFENNDDYDGKWTSLCAWGPTAMLPIFQILGTQYKDVRIISKVTDSNKKFDAFTKIEFIYDDAVASIKVAQKAKSEGELIITGTKGYLYVPAPWWKTDYFEIRYENPRENKRYFYQLDGEGIRYEIAAFAKSVSTMRNYTNVPINISIAICKVIEDFYDNKFIKI